jgi:hypothetical protein
MENMRKLTCYMLTVLIMSLSLPGAARADDGATVSGSVRDTSGAVIADADVSLLTAQQAVINTVKTDQEGRFTFNDVSDGNYQLLVTSKGFLENRLPVTVRKSAAVESLDVVLELKPITEVVTVTAVPGTVESVERVAQQVNIISDREISERAKSVVAQVASEEVGIHLQRTSPTVSAWTQQRTVRQRRDRRQHTVFIYPPTVLSKRR